MGFAWVDTIRRTLARYFREAGAGEPELEGALLFALIDGVTQHFVVDPEHYPLEQMADRIVGAYSRAERSSLFTRAGAEHPPPA